VKTSIANVEVSCSERSPYALSCECDGAAYHIWLDRETRVPKDNKLYKNAIAPDNYRTRHLRTDSAFGKELVRLMLDEAKAHDLFLRAERKVLEDREKEAQQTAEAARIARIKEHGIELLAALKELSRQVEISNAIDDHGHALKNLKALHDARDAIQKAES
jgi:hypothetical protein